MEITLELRDSSKELYWEYKDSFEISLKEDDLKEKQKAIWKDCAAERTPFKSV